MFAFSYDPKRVNHALFGSWYEEDIYDRLCGRLPRLAWLLKGCIPDQMRARRLVFVHVPRVAGTSITRALYGAHCVHHHSIRFYRAVDPQLCAAGRSFALLRDPFDRFASAFSFVRTGGTPTCRLSDVFVEKTRNVRSVQDYLSFLEDRPVLEMDFVMRPQSWFVCDLKTGTPLVHDLFLYGTDDAAFARYLAGYGVYRLPRLNRSQRLPLRLDDAQRDKIRKLYAADFALIDRLTRDRADNPPSAAIAAE